jgi:hypothetical protein
LPKPMMKNIFQQALGVSDPWYIESLEFDELIE